MVKLSFAQEFEHLIKSIETYKPGVGEPIVSIVCESKGLTDVDALRLIEAVNNNPHVAQTLIYLSLANATNVSNNDANQISCALDLTGLKCLKVLRLSNNKLERAPKLSNSQALLQLHLDGNQLRFFPYMDFAKLEILNLRHNRITAFPLLRCPTLSHLYLGFNAIAYPPFIFATPRLQVLELRGNNLSKAGESALYALMCMKKQKFNLLYDKNCERRLTRDSLFEHFTSVAGFKDLLPKKAPPYAPLFLHFADLSLEENVPNALYDLAAGEPTSPIIRYFRNFIIPTLLPLPIEIARIISSFLLPKTKFSKHDAIALSTFKAIFKYWKSRNTTYNPLEEIVKFESEITQLPAIEKNLQTSIAAHEIMQNLIELNNFIRDNKFNPQCLLLENEQGQTPLDLASAQNNERVKSRILSMLPAEEKLKARLQFPSATLSTYSPEAFRLESDSITSDTSDEALFIRTNTKDLENSETTISVAINPNLAINKPVEFLGFSSPEQSIYSTTFGNQDLPYENLVTYQKSLTLSPKLLAGHNEPYYECAVTSDGSCLFYAVAFALLFPIAHDVELFRQRFIKLFGEESAHAAEENRRHFVENNGQEIIQNPEILQILINHNLRKRVVNFMRAHAEEFHKFIPENQNFAARMDEMENPNKKIWADQPEIAAMSKMLKVNITVYQGQGEVLTPVIGAQHKIEDCDTEICLLYTQAMADIGVSNPNNHYNYLLQKKDLPTNKAIFKNKKIATETYSALGNIIATPTQLAFNISNAIGSASSENSPVFASTIKDSANKNSTTGPYVSNHSSVFYLPSFKNAIRGYLPSLKDASSNIGKLAKIPSNMLAAFNAKRAIANGIKLASSAGATGVINCVQRLAEPMCSANGIGAFRSHF